jgi:FAD/FMN-containing dehydrogenase
VHALAVRLGGSFSAEHGVGQLKRELLRATRSPVALDLMMRLKQAFDPDNLMNPGKVL